MTRADGTGPLRSPAPGDDGRPDPRLAAALAADDGSPARRSEVWAALAGARVFLALEARAVAHETSAVTGLVQESEATMVLLGIGAPSGARALPAFLDGHEVQRWQPRARPVPLTGPAGCRTVLDDGAQALLLDPLGAALAVSGFELGELAAGRVPVPGAALSTRRVESGRVEPGASGEADVQLVVALARALRPEPEVRAARLLPGPDGPVLGVWVPSAAGSEPVAVALVALANRVRQRLGSDLPPGGMDLTLVGEHGDGQPVPLAGRVSPGRRFVPGRWQRARR